MGAIALIVRIGMGTPIIYRQVRPGFKEEPFALLKFRTMSNATDEHGQLLPDGARLTRVGALLRRSSLDELPAIVNVLKGDLALVGPRPLLTRYGPFYTEEERRRFDVRPGITGWAQVNGRNSVQWDQRLAMDIWYVENRSLALDLKILVLTAAVVIRAKGVNVVPTSNMLSLDQERAGR